MNTTPRRASSLNDLRVGQAVAWATRQNAHEPRFVGGFITKIRPDCFIVGVDEWHGFDSECAKGEWVILADPEPEPVTIPRDVYDRLKEAYEKGYSSRDALRAVIDAVEGGQ